MPPVIDNKEYSWEELLRIGVETGQVPRFLYKYRAPDPEDAPDSNRYTEKVIRNQELWFSNPSGFNDPFDGQIYGETDNTFEEIKQFLQRVASQHFSAEEIEIRAQHYHKEPEQWRKLVTSAIKRVSEGKGVCCFADAPDNILMWSYYTNSHAGLCLKIDVLANLTFFLKLLPVKYRKKYPMYNHARSRDDSAQKLILTKSKQWKHEREWRVIKDKPGLYSFKNALVEVIFGCKASPDFVKRIKLVATEAGLNDVLFKKAQVSETDFLLTIQDLA